MSAHLDGELASLLREAWTPVFGRDASKLGVAGGEMTMGREEAWPQCRSCQRALRGVLELDLALVPASQLRADALLQVFLCDDAVCAVQGGALARRQTLRETQRSVSEPTEPARFVVDWVRHVELPAKLLGPRLAPLQQRLDAAGIEFEQAAGAVGPRAQHGTKLAGYARSNSLAVELRQDQLVLQLEQKPPMFSNVISPGYALFVLDGPTGLDLVWGK